MNKFAVAITACLFVILVILSIELRDTSSIDLSEQERIEGNVRYVDYVDENGKVTMHPKNGYATQKQIRDDEKHPVEEYYYDEFGQPVARTGGYYGIHRVYENGNCVLYTYVDADNQPTKSTSGYAAVRQTFNEENKVADQYYLDTEYNQVALSTGQYGEHREYNSDGKNYKSTFIDADGNPMENQRGYSTLIREYSPEGDVSFVWYFDLSGNPVDVGRGQYGIRQIYKDGVLIKSLSVDANGHHPFFLDMFLSENPWLIGVIAIVLVAISLFLSKWQRILLLAAYSVVVLYMTLIIRESGDSSHNFTLLWSYSQAFTNRNVAIQVLCNIWLFVPLGAMLCSQKQKPWALLLAVAMSVLIEASQLVFGLGLCEFDDVISNSVGAWLGYGCFREGYRWKNRRHTGECVPKRVITT